VTIKGEAGEVWIAWALFVGAYLAFSISRNIGFRFWNPLAARNMQEMTNEGFRRVQSFSADWHADTFAGATVRRLSRAMWGYDSVSDAVVIWLGPALLLLAGQSLLIGLRWPLVGAMCLFVVLAFLWLNLWLVKVWVRPANLRSNALDSRIGGALADALGSNPTVKGFGAEAREEERFGKLTEQWATAVQVTWGRFMDIWLMQNLLTMALQAVMTGTLVWLWTKGRATPGDIAFGITTFMQMNGYLRNIGENVRMFQKGVDDVEDVANYARMSAQVADPADPQPFQAEEGEIVFDDVTFRYKSADAPLYDDFSLRIAPGERVALVGPTGAGKSTFINILAGLTRKTSGTVKIWGRDIDERPRDARAAIGVVPQELAADVFFTPRESLEVQAGMYGVPKKERRTDELLAAMGLSDKANAYVRQLSGGMKRRLMIARAMVHEPRLLILDEPTAGVDIELRRSMWDFLTELNGQGVTIILTTHYLEEAEMLCRHIAIIDKGTIVEDTDMKSLLGKLQVEHFLLDLREPLAATPQLEGYTVKQLDDRTLEVAVAKSQSLNAVFTLLSAQGIEVMSLRNRANRLEELFVSMVEKNLKTA